MATKVGVLGAVLFGVASTFAAAADGCERIEAALALQPSQTRFERFRDAAAEDADRCAAASGARETRSQALFASALAARREDIALLLLERGVRPASLPAAVNAAAERELPAALGAPLELDASLLKSAHGGRTPLAVAAASGSYRAAKALLDAGADPDFGLPVVAAVRNVNSHIARLLMDRGARVAALPPDAADLLLATAAEFSTWQFLDHLLDMGLDPNLKGPEGHALFHAARHDTHRDRPGFMAEGPVSSGGPQWFHREMERLQRMCEPGAHEEPSVELGAAETNADACARIESALATRPWETFRRRMLAASLEDAVACVRAVGASSRRANYLAYSALWARRDDIVIGLLERGSAPAPLAGLAADAAALDRRAVLKAVLDKDPALVNAKFMEASPLEEAATEGAYRAAKLLLDRGADPFLGSPLKSALLRYRLDVAQLLIERTGGGSAFDPAAAGDALGEAAWNANWRFVDHMLKSGFDANLRNREGYHVLLATNLNATFGEDAWGTLVMHGADPLAAVCEQDDESIAETVGKPPWSWTGERILDYRKRCPEDAPIEIGRGPDCAISHPRRWFDAARAR